MLAYYSWKLCSFITARYSYIQYGISVKDIVGDASHEERRLQDLTTNAITSKSSLCIAWVIDPSHRSPACAMP